MTRYILIGLGLITLSLGLMGIVTPGLPTTPFILLTAALFAKSSPRLHQKLLNNKITGPYLNRVNNGLGIKGLLISISIMWLMITLSVFFVFKDSVMFYIMPCLGIIGTVAQIIVLSKNRRRNKTNIPLSENHIIAQEAEQPKSYNIKKNV